MAVAEVVLEEALVRDEADLMVLSLGNVEVNDARECCILEFEVEVLVVFLVLGAGLAEDTDVAFVNLAVPAVLSRVIVDDFRLTAEVELAND